MADWQATEAQAERAITMLKKIIEGAENSNQAAENAAVIAYAFSHTSLEVLEDRLSDIISDSIDMDWSPTDGAKAIVRRFIRMIPDDVKACTITA